MALKQILTQARLKEILNYDPETGVFTWKVRLGSRANAGNVAGHAHNGGYRAIRLDGKAYLSHRLVFLYVSGEWPDEVDHINHIRADNRLVNLRMSCRGENGKNYSISQRNKSGLTGVARYKITGKWYAQIRAGEERIYLGTYSSFFDAVAARKSAELKYGFHENHGK